MASAPDQTRIAVIGAGAFGRSHLRVLRELELTGAPVALAAVVDPNPDIRAQAAEAYAIPTHASVEEFLSANREPGRLPSAACVCVPTLHHAAAARPLLAAGLDLLIEKPLAATLAEADELIALAAHHRRILQIGHLERFNPAVAAAQTRLNRPMFFEAHRLSIFTARSLDVDVVLDLMIHDLDVVLALAGSEVEEVRAVGLPVLSRNTDIANVRLAFRNGAVANFTASRVSTERVRKLRFFQPHQYLSLDFARQDLLVIEVPPAAIGLTDQQLAALVEHHTQAQHAGPRPAGAPEGQAQHPTAGLNLTKVPVKPGEPLRLELQAFLHAIRTRTEPIVDAHAGRRALALALEINAAIAAHATRAGL